MLFDNLAASPEDDTINVDFSSLLLQFATFIGRFNEDAAAARSRVKFCALIESASKRAEARSLMRNDSWSQEILSVISEWIKDPAQVCFVVWL
jgi:hypothetical protein